MKMDNAFGVMFALVLLAGMASAGLSVSSFSVSQASFKPGASGVITLDISNPLVTGVTVKSVSSVSMEIFSPPEITVTGQQFIGSIEPGGTTRVSLPFRVGATATSSIYSVEVRLTGVSDRSDGGGYDTFSRSTTIPVTVLNAPILSLSTDKQVIGGIEAVALTVSNNGGPLRNLRISIPSTSTVAFYGLNATDTQMCMEHALTSASTVAFYGLNELYVGDVLASKVVNLTLDARNASDGATGVSFTMNYEDELGLPHSDASTLHLTVKNEVLDLRFNQLQPLVTRTDGTLSLEVTNNGQALSDVRLSFTNTSMRLRDRNEVVIGDLAAGEKKTVSAAVYNDLTPGLNRVGAKISWIERDIRKEQQLDVPLTIGSDADVSVYLDSKPSPLTTGVEHTISVLVSNVGSYGIDNVDVGISSPAFESLDITPRQYIGSLAKDDFSTVQFKVKVDSGPGDYPISINVRYRDASGAWVTRTIDQAASVKGVPSNGSGTLYLLVGLVAIAAAAVWYFRLRKKG